MNTKRFTHSNWLIGALACILIAFFLLIGSVTFFKDAHSVDTNISMGGKAYLSFSSTYASVGKPLTVSLNSENSKGIQYEWTVGETHINNTTDTYTPTVDDLEKFITVKVTYGNSESLSATLYCSKLPVIYLNADSMIGDSYVSGTMAMQGNESYNSSNSELYFGDVYIKLRGNSTKSRPKAPYKIKLAESSNLLGMGSSKHWVLLANDIDHTFIRNKLVYDFSADIGASYATESENVVLILNNTYRGVYQLCEQIRVDEERIDIFDWDGLADEAAMTISQIKSETEGLKGEELKTFRDNLEYALKSNYSWASEPYTFTFEGKSYNISEYVDIPDTTGGFLLEMDFYNLSNPNGVKTNYQQPFYFNTPETGFTNKNLKSYAYRYIQSFEYALHSEDHIFHSTDVHYAGKGWYYDQNNGWMGEEKPAVYSDPANDGKHYTELFDMNSLVVNFFVCEFTMNWDSMKNSVFVTKDIDSLAELCPAWDFDWAFGNNNMYNIPTNFPTGWHTTNNYFTNEQYYQSVQWNRYLVRDPYFLKLAYEKYQEIRPTVIENIIKDGGLLDQYYDDLYEAGVANDSKWHSTYRSYNGESFENSMKSLKEFITTRIEWMDEQFASFDTFVKSIGYYKISNEIAVNNIEQNDDGTITITAYTSNKNCSDIAFQINGTTVKTSFAGTDGIAKVTIPNSVLNESGKNIVEVHGVNSSDRYIDGLHNYLVF